MSLNIMLVIGLMLGLLVYMASRIEFAGALAFAVLFAAAVIFFAGFTKPAMGFMVMAFIINLSTGYAYFRILKVYRGYRTVYWGVLLVGGAIIASGIIHYGIAKLIYEVLKLA